MAVEMLPELSTESSGGVFASMLDPEDPCLLGAASLLLMQVLAEWQRGRFLTAVVAFALLHDQFLTNLHPEFYDRSSWPLRDADVRSMKDVLLYNVRKFRALAAEMALDAGEQPSLGSALDLADARERENLEGFARHLWAQRRQHAKRDLVPEWEPSPLDALAQSWDPGPSLRVFVYDESVPGLGTLTRGPAYCHNRHWGMDVGFHDFFRVSPLRTLDPMEADIFFVPAYAICLQVAGMLELEALQRAFEALVPQLTFFNRTRGRDHVFALHYRDLFAGWRDLAPLSIFLTPETEVGWERSYREDDIPASRPGDSVTLPPFDSQKDIVVPPFMPLSHVLELNAAAQAPKERTLIAVFAGKLWADIREAHDIRNLLRLRLAGRPGVAVIVGDSMHELIAPNAMARLMGDARFCLVPRGRAAWSVRFFETLWSGCVPVLLSDHYEVPFEALFDVSEFVVKWPISRIDDSLYEYLASLPLEVVESYMSAGKRVRCFFLYPPPEVSWLPKGAARRELEEVEAKLCPNLSSSRNAFQAVAELLTRRKRVSKTAMGNSFYWPDSRQWLSNSEAGKEQDGSPREKYRPCVTDARLGPLVPLHSPGCGTGTYSRATGRPSGELEGARAAIQ